MTVAEQRRRRAIEVATRVARRYGIEARHPQVISDSNNTLVHLAPAPVVAKVSTTTIRKEGPKVLERELAIARYLAGRAPITVPSEELPAEVHRDDDGQAMTFWRYYSSRAGPDSAETEIAAALQAFHRAFDSYPGELPVFRDEFLRLRSHVLDDRSTRQLTARDRRFLLDEHDRMWDILSAWPFSQRRLHGDPHERNRLVTEHGLLFCDFEASCLGPLEWDLSSVSEESSTLFRDVDTELLGFLRDARSLWVAVLCWIQLERAPEVAQAARFHLDRLRRRLPR